MQDMKETKFCVDCKCCKKGGSINGFSCRHPSYGLDIVTGKSNEVSCAIARSNFRGECKADALLFEPKETNGVIKPNDTMFSKIINLFKKD